MEFEKFRDLMRTTKPRKPVMYHRGLLIDDRKKNGQLDLIAKYVMILWELNVARIYQKRNGDCCDYYVVLTRKLSVRKDEQGSFQEAERLLAL